MTAISELDLSIEANTIVSVIGPNGAGKTTLFNCITGLVAPSGGSVRFSGDELRLRWSWRVTAACLLTGVACGLAVAALAIDVNGLWRAAIRRPASFQNTPFSARHSWEQLVGYLRGDLAIERRHPGRLQIVTADGRTPLGVAADQDEAEALRDELDSLSRHAHVARVVGRSNVWMVERGSGPTAHRFGPFPSRDAA
ncbi:MAG: ATP-binding cassette domain-containing protein, partial [Candidatus Saccharimonadales bacterium]